MPALAYLDCNATAPLRPEARDAMAAAMDLGGNPSSVHRAGRLARRAIEDARAAVADLAACGEAEVVFTSGGTEANWMAISGAARAGRVARVLVSAVEHPCVMAAADATGLPVERVPVRADGTLDLVALEASVAAGGLPALLCLMAANNETGVLQPVAEAAALMRAADGLAHVDAVQAAGKVPMALYHVADTLALSAHKLGGPQGVGALAIRDPSAVALPGGGGGQEMRRRAGTENVTGIAGFGAAAAAAASGDPHTAALRDEAERRAGAIAAASGHAMRVAGADAPRLPNTACLAFAGVKAETLVMALDLAGVCVSAGSACSSGKVTRSHVLDAMGWNDALAGGAIRVSFGWASTMDDVDRFAAALETALGRIAPRMTQSTDPAPAAIQGR